MNDNDLMPLTLEPAITPAFLAQLDKLPRQPRIAEPPDLAWSTFLFSALRQRTPQPAAQPRKAQVTPR
jgi:hypothetical protein